MNRVFVDTGGFYAALNGNDDHHADAAAVFHRAASESWRLLTSNFVVAETHALVLVRCGADLARAWLRDVPAAVMRVSIRDEAKARAIVLEYRDKEFSYCDASSFAVMERLRIRRVIAFDDHFRQYGTFQLVTA